jgi:hypothetical protein
MCDTSCHRRLAPCSIPALVRERWWSRRATVAWQISRCPVPEFSHVPSVELVPFPRFAFIIYVYAGKCGRLVCKYFNDAASAEVTNRNKSFLDGVDRAKKDKRGRDSDPNWEIGSAFTWKDRNQTKYEPKCRSKFYPGGTGRETVSLWAHTSGFQTTF